MSKKETVQTETQQKVVTKYDKKVQKRKEAELKAKKQQKMDRIVGIAVAAIIVIAIAFVPVRKYIASHSTYITVGGCDVTQVEFDYYYNVAAGNYINTYGSYLSYMGLDTTSDFSTQMYSDTLTWKDYFEQLAVDNLRQNKALIAEAEAAGFTYDTSLEYELFKDTLKDAAAEAGQSLGTYYKANFGRYASASGIKPFVEEGYLASAYYKSVAESREAAAEEIQAYYDENTATYDSVDYLLTEVVAEIPETEKITNEDGTTSTVEPTEEQIQTAMDAAKAKADEALEVIDEQGTANTNKLKSSISTYYNDWLFDEERAEGDTTIIEDTTNNKYYVLKFQNRYLDETLTATIRAIMTTTESGDVILGEWAAAGSTEEAFIELVPKYSEDTYTNANGGLYQELTKSTLNSTMSDWIFAEDRNPGDAITLEEEGATYVLYYVEEGRPEWQAKIANTLLSTDMDEYLTVLKDACEVTDPKGNLNYLTVQDTTTESTTAE